MGNGKKTLKMKREITVVLPLVETTTWPDDYPGLSLEAAVAREKGRLRTRAGAEMDAIIARAIDVSGRTKVEVIDR